MEVSGQDHEPVHRYPLNRNLGRPQSQSEKSVEKKKTLAPAQIQTPGRPAHSKVTLSTEPYRFLMMQYTIK
jgi:hypothetical protein